LLLRNSPVTKPQPRRLGLEKAMTSPGEYAAGRLLRSAGAAINSLLISRRSSPACPGAGYQQGPLL